MIKGKIALPFPIFFFFFYEIKNKKGSNILPFDAITGRVYVQY